MGGKKKKEKIIKSVRKTITNKKKIQLRIATGRIWKDTLQKEEEKRMKKKVKTSWSAL